MKACEGITFVESLQEMPIFGYQVSRLLIWLWPIQLSDPEI